MQQALKTQSCNCLDYWLYRLNAATAADASSQTLQSKSTNEKNTAKETLFKFKKYGFGYIDISVMFETHLLS